MPGRTAEPAAVVRLLLERGLTLGSAESLTGGLLGAAVTSVPGSSAVYVGGVLQHDGVASSNPLAAEASAKLHERLPRIAAQHGWPA